MKRHRCPVCLVGQFTHYCRRFHVPSATFFLITGLPKGLLEFRSIGRGAPALKRMHDGAGIEDLLAAFVSEFFANLLDDRDKSARPTSALNRATTRAKVGAIRGLGERSGLGSSRDPPEPFSYVPLRSRERKQAELGFNVFRYFDCISIMTEVYCLGSSQPRLASGRLRIAVEVCEVAPDVSPPYSESQTRCGLETRSLDFPIYFWSTA